MSTDTNLFWVCSSYGKCHRRPFFHSLLRVFRLTLSHLIRGATVTTTEQATEMIVIEESHRLRHLGDGMLLGLQQVHGLTQTNLVDVLQRPRDQGRHGGTVRRGGTRKNVRRFLPAFEEMYTLLLKSEKHRDGFSQKQLEGVFVSTDGKYVFE